MPQNLIRIVVAALAVAALLSPTAGGGSSSSGPGVGNERARPLGFRPAKHPKLASALAELATAPAQVSLRKAWSLGLRVHGADVRVEVQAVAGAARVRSAISRLGGRVERTYGRRLQVLVPPSSLRALAGLAGVRYVGLPQYGYALAIPGEEVAATGANAWQSAGFTGAGVKVAVIDLGFAGWRDRQAQGDLPPNVITQDFCQGRFETATEHGAGVGELVYEMAPGAQLYLICISSVGDVAAAVAYAKAQGIHIVNHSVGYFNAGRGDGSGPIGSIIADARASGILWVNAAGNHAQRHWTGTFSDPDGDKFHNFSATDEGQTLFLGAGRTLCAFLRWDEWPATATDYDIYLSVSATGQIVAASEADQTGSQPPLEQLCYTNATGLSQNFALFLVAFNAVNTPRIDLFVNGTQAEYQVPAGSILDPATQPRSFTIGAICWLDSSLEPYSSQGPTIDGRTKPDLAGQDSETTGTYGPFSVCGQSGFTGTSAASPTVAGAAALVKHANPTYTADQIQTFLEGRAGDLGVPGRDNQFGAGRLQLGAAGVGPVTKDTVPPKARALASTGKRGTQVKLRLQASDETGEVRLRVQVKTATKTLATISVGFTKTDPVKTYFVNWRAPARLTGTIKHCLQAFDRTGNASAVSCAKLTITR